MINYDSAYVVSRNDLCLAMSRASDFDIAAIRDMADHLLAFLGFSNNIIDNYLTSNDRDLFYMAQEIGVVTTERDEITTHRGKPWRIHFWLFDKKNIFDLVYNYKEPEKEVEKETTVYDDLSDECWIRTE